MKEFICKSQVNTEKELNYIIFVKLILIYLKVYCLNKNIKEYIFYI